MFEKSSVTIRNCDVQNFGFGILLDYSGANTLSNNIFSDNRVGIMISGEEGGTVNNDNIIENNIFISNRYSLLLGPSSYNTIKNNAFYDNYDGIIVESYSDNNIIMGNSLSNNGRGIVFNYECFENKVHDNNVSNNDYGIYIKESYLTDVVNNIVSNNKAGIYIYHSDESIIRNNTLDSNNKGIVIGDSQGSIIEGNIITGNDYGFWDLDGYGITIFNNYFNNAENAYVIHTSYDWNTLLTPGTNIVGGPNLGGNFWANPEGTGFSETCTNRGDGICDSPYDLFGDGTNVDNLPLAPVPELPTIEEFPAVIESLDLPAGTESSLLASVENAQKSIDNGNNGAAINQLEAFINKVEAQTAPSAVIALRSVEKTSKIKDQKSGKKIPAEDAEQLISYANNVIAGL